MDTGMDIQNTMIAERITDRGKENYKLIGVYYGARHFA